MNMLLLVSDAYGGRGGIAAYNREFVQALSLSSRTRQLTVVPRVQFAPTGPLPRKVVWDASGLGGAAAYAKACIRHVLSSSKFDHVHCGHINLAPFAVAVATVRRVPCTLSIHGIDAWQPHSRWIVRQSLRAMDQIFAVSRYTKDRFAGWSGLSNVTIVPNAVHLDDFGVRPRLPALQARYGVADKTVLMTFGRLAGRERAKGFDEVLDALPALSKSIPNVAYLICGDGEDRARLEAKARALGVADQVVFTGYVAEAEKADLLQLADVFVMPSHGEGFGIVLLEALACGVPVVGSVMDGARDALLDGQLGLLVDPRDQDGIIQAILESLAKPRIVNPGLAYYSFANFAKRLNHSLGIDPQ